MSAIRARIVSVRALVLSTDAVGFSLTRPRCARTLWPNLDHVPELMRVKRIR
jgi:hypothetical protein